MKILAIDLGKSKMVGCVYDTQTHEHRFDAAPLDRSTLRGVLEVERPDRVVIEVGPSAGWVGDVIRQAGVELQVANPNPFRVGAGETSNARRTGSMRSSWPICRPATSCPKCICQSGTCGSGVR